MLCRKKMSAAYQSYPYGTFVIQALEKKREKNKVKKLIHQINHYKKHFSKALSEDLGHPLSKTKDFSKS